MPEWFCGTLAVFCELFSCHSIVVQCLFATGHLKYEISKFISEFQLYLHLISYAPQRAAPSVFFWHFCIYTSAHQCKLHTYNIRLDARLFALSCDIEYKILTLALYRVPKTFLDLKITRDHENNNNIRFYLMDGRSKRITTTSRKAQETMDQQKQALIDKGLIDEEGNEVAKGNTNITD